MSFAIHIRLEEGKQVYFASDFHLGIKNSTTREREICAWLDFAAQDAQVIFLVGDIFDFWFEYKNAIPKGFIRFQGKLAELIDKGVEIIFFTGNHDMWLFDYFTKELGIKIFRQPIDIKVDEIIVHIGHGDGLGPGDRKYKFLKKIFANPLCQWFFGKIHPDWGIGLASYWSRHSRLQSSKKGDEQFLGEGEWLWTYCKEQEAKQHRDLYIFGHRHLPLDLPVGENARYINLGEWLHHYTYACFKQNQISLKEWKRVFKSM